MRVKSQERRAKGRTVGQAPPLDGSRPRSGSRLSTLVTRFPRGLTLIELLVVIIILTTLVSAAIPLLAPTNDDRRLREASRGVNAFITGAQMKAIQLQRPVGVAIKRLSQDTKSNDDNAVCVELYYVEQPAPYRGFDRTSSAMVARHPTKSGQVMVQFVARGTQPNNDYLPAGWDADLFPPNLIRPGDVVEIDGTRYELLVPTSVVLSRVKLENQLNRFYLQVDADRAVIIEARPINDTGQMLNIEFDQNGDRMRDLPAGSSPQTPFWTSPAPYKILRQPAPTSNEPFQLPDGTAIDLRASGVGHDDFFYVPGVHDNSDGVIIMFAPEGRVSRVTFSRQPPVDEANFDEAVTDNLFLLVGRRENAPPPDVASDPTLNSSRLNGKNEQQLQEMKEAVNWLRSESRWIAIGSQSGRVVTVDNAFVGPQAVITKNLAPPNVMESSEEMRNAQIDAAREFAREMTQAGGR